MHNTSVVTWWLIIVVSENLGHDYCMEELDGNNTLFMKMAQVFRERKVVLATLGSFQDAEKENNVKKK